MKLKTTVADLRKALRKITPVIERRSSIPVLSTAKLTAADGVVSLMATNMDMFIRATFEAEILDAGGEVLLEARPVAGLLADLPGDGIVTLEVNENGLAHINVVSDDITASWAALNSWVVADYPTYPKIEGVKFAFGLETLRSLLGRVQFAMSTEETRYYLNGIYLHLDGHTMVSVATDGHRMAILRRRLDGNFPFAEFQEHVVTGIILPRLAVQRVLVNLPKTGGNAAVDCQFSKDTPGWISFDTGTAKIVTRAIDGSFPDYTRVVPSKGADGASTTFIESAVLSRFLRIALSVHKGDGTSPIASFAFDGPSLDINLKTMTGSVQGRIAAAHVGAPKTTGINAAYVAAVVKALDCDNVTLEFVGEHDPILAYGNDPDFTCVQMGARV